ncbi:MAG: hypothetical protein K0Q94_6774 [Paenibacillus sp.]|jgi:hypothetical protein|nr:hypothetical protein [Paenibacillus sp.]
MKERPDEDNTGMKPVARSKPQRHDFLIREQSSRKTY